MGLREWFREMYRVIFATEEQGARMYLADGEYSLAAMCFRSSDMHREAAEAYMKAGDAKAEQHYEEYARGFAYMNAFKSYEKIGDHKGMLRACQKCWRFCRKIFEAETIAKLRETSLLEQFVRNARDQEPYWLADQLETAGEYDLAIDTYIFAYEQRDDAEEKYMALWKAVECGLAGPTSTEKLLELHEALFRADIAKAKSSLNLMFHVSHMNWVAESGNLVTFIDRFVEEHPVCLWYTLHEWYDHLKNDIRVHCIEQRACGMLACVRAINASPSANSDWQFVDSHNNRYGYTAAALANAEMFAEAAEMYVASAKLNEWDGELAHAVSCYKEAGMPLKAAQILEQTGEFREAAAQAEDAGNSDLAIRLYERALQDQDVSENEAGWIKMTLKRLRGEQEESSTVEAEPEGSCKAPIATGIGRTCAKCGAEVPEGDKFCSDCGCRLGNMCPNCGANIAAGKKFCGKCGSEYE